MTKHYGTFHYFLTNIYYLMEPILQKMTVNPSSKTVSFCSNAPADPSCFQFLSGIDDLEILMNYKAFKRWKSNSRKYEIGEHSLQRHLVEVMKTVGQDLRGACASNLIFLRSPGHYGVKYPDSTKACWGIHEMILEIVQPRIILAFGNGQRSPYDFLHRQYNVYENEEIDSEHGNWKCRFFKTNI